MASVTTVDFFRRVVDRSWQLTKSVGSLSMYIFRACERKTLVAMSTSPENKTAQSFGKMDGERIVDLRCEQPELLEKVYEFWQQGDCAMCYKDSAGQSGSSPSTRAFRGASSSSSRRSQIALEGLRILEVVPVLKCRVLMPPLRPLLAGQSLFAIPSSP